MTPSLVNNGDTIAGDLSNRFRFWLNISSVVNHRWTFWLIIDIAIDLFTWEDKYFLWITVVRFCVYNADPHPGDARMRDTLLCVLARDSKTPQFPRNFRPNMGCNRIPMHTVHNSTNFIWITASQQYLLHVTQHNCSEMLGPNIGS